jgi:hypothetical protein
VRHLVKQSLFGTMPIENRVQDPLMTFTATGWLAFADDGSAATVLHVVDESPTHTPFLSLPAAQNLAGASIVGEVKTEQTPLHVEVWLGCDDAHCDPAAPGASFIGVVAGGGETSTDLTAGPSTHIRINGRTWEKLSAEIPSGGLGWSFLLSRAPYLCGAVVVDVPANANADLASTPSRVVNDHERAMLRAVRDRTMQQLAR